jgi:hypothetical protein
MILVLGDFISCFLCLEHVLIRRRASKAHCTCNARCIPPFILSREYSSHGSGFVFDLPFDSLTSRITHSVTNSNRDTASVVSVLNAVIGAAKTNSCKLEGYKYERELHVISTLIVRVKQQQIFLVCSVTEYLEVERK